MATNIEVIIIGAGMAGLAAACELGRAGVPVQIIEARDRIGGRVLTVRDEACNAPVELGAEFIHGCPPETLKFLQNAKVHITEVQGDSWCVNADQLAKCDFESEVDSILDNMDDSSPDEPFQQYLERCCRHANPEAKQRATSYVSGFNAADPGLVGTHWLVQGMRAEEQIQGDRAFRSPNGYSDLVDIFRQQLEQYGIPVRTGNVVESVAWNPGNAEVSVHGANGVSIFEAARVLVTLPLSMLKLSARHHGAIRFSPELPAQVGNALDKLEMGKVVRVVLRFRERFWENIRPRRNESLSEMSFLFSQDEWFPTWWTNMPRKDPILVGWAPFRSAERLSGQTESFIVDRSLQTLGGLLKVSPRELEGLLGKAYVHDWQSDPFSRGAYSYGKVGAVEAESVLAEPLQGTLFFAGEATDIAGHNGTVHGAIASGCRAARQIMQVLG
jgi:monoamine oxidase